MFRKLTQPSGEIRMVSTATDTKYPTAGTLVVLDVGERHSFVHTLPSGSKRWETEMYPALVIGGNVVNGDVRYQT